MNTKYFDSNGDRISEAEFYKIHGDGYTLNKEVGGPNDFPDLSTIQIASMQDSGLDDGRMAVEVVLKIEGQPPAWPGFFLANLAWGHKPDERHSVPLELKDGLAMADLIMGADGWFYDPAKPGEHGPGIIWISARDGSVVNCEQGTGVGWHVFTNHRRVSRFVFEAFGVDPSGTPDDPPDPPIDPPPPGDLGPALILLFSSSELLVQAEVLREGADDLTEQARQQLAEAAGLLVELAGG